MYASAYIVYLWSKQHHDSEPANYFEKCWQNGCPRTQTHLYRLKKSINNMMNTALDKWGLLQYYTRVHYKLHSSEGILDIVKRGGGGLADLRKFQEGIKQG